MSRIAMLAGMYAVLSFAAFFASFGAVQYRVSEALTVLPVYLSEAIPGLSLGCALTNLLGFFCGLNPAGPFDALFGTAATLLAAILTRLIGKKFSRRSFWRYFLCPLPSVVLNGIIVGFELSLVFAGSLEPGIFFTNAALVALGQTVICYGLGVPLMLLLDCRPAVLRRLTRH